MLTAEASPELGTAVFLMAYLQFVVCKLARPLTLYEPLLCRLGHLESSGTDKHHAPLEPLSSKTWNFKPPKTFKFAGQLFAPIRLTLDRE